MNRYDSLIDEALDRYPMQPLPAGFTKRVISRLPAPQPRFHLDFLDLILPVFFVMFGVLALFVAGWVAFYMDPLWLSGVQLQIQLLVLELSVYQDWPVVSLALVIASGLGLAIIITFAWLASSFDLVQRVGRSPRQTVQ
jgi:hypothetical protein